jgi:hypothetical protein
MALTAATLVSDIASARTRFGDRAAILVETVQLRRRAAAKFADASGWLFTDEALQQATAQPVAEHRARRLAGAIVHDATCSIGSELAALRNSASVVLGSDVDPVRLAMARHNLGAEVSLCRADALRPITADGVMLVDPARRSGSRRRFDPRAYKPPLDDLLGVLTGRDHVVKCAPGIDFAALAQMGFDGEIEITSLSGSVREACLWSRGLGGTVRRRATMLGEIFNASKVECRVLENLRQGRWEKLIWNVPFNGISAVLDQDTQAILSTPQGWELIRQLMEDVYVAAKSDGITLDPKLIQENLDRTTSMGPYKSSMQIDREVGRPMEIEAILGEPVRVAKRNGASVPREIPFFLEQQLDQGAMW